VSSVGQEGVLRPARAAAPANAWTLRAQRAQDFLSRESPLIVAWGLMTGLWLYVGGGFAADSWLTLLGGRELLAHGLPHHDSLAILSHGRTWIDQQWLAQLFYYGLYKLGGLSLVSRANVLLFASAAGIGLVAARRRGASPSRVLVCALPALLLTARFVRAEVPAQVLFMLLLVLLVAESRRPSRRIVLAFPLVILWGNVHGSAVLGAAMVSLLGIVELPRALRAQAGPRVARSLALSVGAWPCLLLTPYGSSVLSYYRATLVHPAFAKYVTEWQPPTFPSLWGGTFFAAAFLTTAVVARRLRSFNGFELGVLLMTLLGALLAVRSAIWFVYAVLVLVPRALEELWPRSVKPRGARVSFRAAVSTVVLGFCLVQLFQPVKNVGVRWPGAATSAIADASRSDPSARIFANDEYADWLLFREPQLRNRIAFDGRWEILRPAQMTAVVNFLFQRTPEWANVARGYRLFVLDPEKNRRVVETYSRRRDMVVLYRDQRVVVYERRIPKL
jgi:hypothetical protein